MKSTEFPLPFRSNGFLTTETIRTFFLNAIVRSIKNPFVLILCTANLCFAQYPYKKMSCEKVYDQKSVKTMKQFLKIFLSSETCDCYQNGEGESSDVFYSAKLGKKRMVFTQWDNSRYGNMVSVLMPSDKFVEIFKEVALDKMFTPFVIGNEFDQNNVNLNGLNMLQVNIAFDPKDNSFGVTPYNGLCCSPVTIYDLENSKQYNLIYKIYPDYNELDKVKPNDLDMINRNIHKIYNNVIQTP